ncbi:MAG: DUF1385 domain-containing protein [Selenomonadaceae bacterium]|nr:DUF1385 domain-containing protein [Selenomonadaceae bacterium]
MEKPIVGVQAVIEGVMMRGFGKVATAVREPSGKINVQVKNISSISERFPILKFPLLRGSVALFESLILGMKSLSFSAQAAGEDDEQLSDKELIGTILLAIGLACALFIAIPTFAAKFFHTLTDDPIILNLAEGFLRLIIFLAYLFAISRMKDIQRVFQYHGAEHKTIFCYEADLPLTVENVKKFPRLHPRCGTAFLLIVMIVSIFVFAFLGWPELWIRILSRIILLPVVAGISYEIIKFSARSGNSFVKLATLPGLWLQYLTTREPDDSMIEVAIKSLEAVTPVNQSGLE